MLPTRLLLALSLLCSATGLSAFSDFSRDQLKLLHDAGGWEYLKMTTSGMQTDHPCFDGKLHLESCRGHLQLSPDNKFTQEVVIQGQSAPRHGTYTLEGDQLTFFDELQTRDGPYTIEIDVPKEALVMQMPQVRIELILGKTLRAKKRKETK